MDGDLTPIARLTEVPEAGWREGQVLYRNREWEEGWPGLAAGITGAGPEADYGLTTASDPWTLAIRAEALCARLGTEAAVMVRQVHGSRVVPVEAGPARGLLLAGEGDGLVARQPGALLVVTAADCFPVYLLDPDSGTLGLVHAGWRGAAAGVLEEGLEAVARACGTPPERILVHLGPGICGECYEVGPEVLRVFGHRAEGPGHVDIGWELGRRARAAGVDAAHLTRSTWCTRCHRDQFHSHRGNHGTAGRMAAFLGWRVTPPRAGCPPADEGLS